MEHDKCNQDTRVMMLFFSFLFSLFFFFFIPQLNSFPQSRVTTFFTVAVAMPHAFCSSLPVGEVVYFHDMSPSDGPPVPAFTHEKF